MSLLLLFFSCTHPFVLFLLESTYNWYHIIFVFLCIISLSILSRSICVAANGRISLFFMAEKYSIILMYMYHIFFNYSSVDGHLGCFHILTIVNSASEYWHACFFSNYFVFSDICSEVGLLDHMVIVFLVFWGTSPLLSIMAATIYSHQQSMKIHFSPNHIQHLLFVKFLMTAVLTGVRW